MFFTTTVFTDMIFRFLYSKKTNMWYPFLIKHLDFHSFT